MNNLSIKFINGEYFLYFDSNYGKKLDNYLRGGWIHYNFKNRNKGVKSSEFLDYLVRLFDNIHLSYSMIKNDFFNFSSKLNSIISKFDSIGFDIDSIVKNHNHEEKYFFNKKNVIVGYFNRCLENFDNNSLYRLIELVNELYYFQVKIFKARDLFFLKDDLMNNLKDVCSLDIYNYYNNLYDSYLKEDILDLKKLENLFLEIQGIILDDWKSKLTNINDYKLGSDFNFICHSACSSNWSGDYYGRYISASLITDVHNYTYNKPFGFIMDPNDIIMTSSEDLFIRNNSDSLDNIYLSGVLPTVQSFKHVCDNTLYYNEVVLDSFNPIGIFCISDGSRELNPYYLEALNLQKNFPNLPIVDLDISFFASDYDTIFYRNDLVDAIEEELGIYSGGNNDYYDYFSYFWDDFMTLKGSSYTSQDIINLFIKYYDLLSADLDEILCSSFDDEFVLKLIYANNRYSSIKRLFNNNFDADDIKSFYEVYSNLSLSSYNRIDKFFPDFNLLLSLLDDYLKYNSYDIESFDLLEKFSSIDKLIGFLSDYYPNSLNNKKRI